MTKRDRRYGTELPQREPDDDDRSYWRTPQSVFYKGRKPETRLRCFDQLNEQQARRRHLAAELASQREARAKR